MGAIGWVGVKFHPNLYRNISTLFTNIPLLLNVNAPQIPLIYKNTTLPNYPPPPPFFFFLTVKAEAEVEVEVEEAHQTFLPLNENPIKTPLSLYFSSKLSKTLSLLTSFSLQKQGRKEKKKEGEEETQKKKKQVLKTQKTLF